MNDKDTGINILLENAPADEANDREVYTNDIDTSYKHEGYILILWNNLIINN